MRDYENSDTSSFNNYRSGSENPRRELSSRTDYGSPASVNRRGSTYATSDHFQQNSVWHQPNEYRDMNRDNNQGNNQNQNSNQSNNQNWNQHRNQQSNWQSDQHNDRSNWQSNQQNRWPQDNRQYQNNYGNHSQDRDYDRHRSGDRNFFERTGDRINETWNRWTNDDNYDRNSSNRYDQNRSNYNTHDSQQHRYSSDYGHQNRANQGRGYDVDRYSNRRDDDRDSWGNRNREHEGEGFFDRVGNYISNAWNSLTQEEREDQDRANRYRNNHNRWDDDDNRSHNRTSGNSGPPYNYGPSPRRDYEW